MAKLILLRHGRSRWNASGISQGNDPDPTNGLDEEGKKEAYEVGRFFAGRGIRPTHAWSSPLPRARQTCDIVLPVMGCQLQVREDWRLREMSKGSRGLPGGLQGRSSKEAKTPAYREGYRLQGWDFRHGSLESGGETAREAGWRFAAALNEIARSLPVSSTALVFTHGQVSRYGWGAILGFPDIKTIDATFRLGNCESLVLDFVVGRSPRWLFVCRMASS